MAKEQKTGKAISGAATAALLWTGLTFYLCGSAVHDHDLKMAGTDKTVADGLSVIAYGVVWTGGLLVIALLKFLLGRK